MWTPTLVEDGRPKYLALVDAISAAIERGELKSGSRLPPQRRLAWALGINPSTVMLAYKEAARRHLISGEVGRGTYVLEGSKEASLFLIKNRPLQAPRIDLSTNIPIVDDVNKDLNATIASLSAAGQLSAAQSYLTPEAIALGQAMAVEWLSCRQIHCQPKRVRLCAGAQQGLLAVLLSLCHSGEPILVEALTAPGIKAAARQLHLPLHGVAMDQYGILPDELDRLVRTTGAKVVVLTPLLQNPTGAVMDDRRRAAIADIVLRYGLTVIEDDVYGALTREAPLATLLPENSLLITSFSKTVAAGLRLGYIVGSESLLGRIDPDTQLTNWAVSPLSLFIACEWIRDGTAKNRLNWQKEAVEQRWRLAKKIVGAAMPNREHISPHIWITPSEGAAGLVERCRHALIDIVPAEVFAVAKQPINGVRISISAARNLASLKIALEAVASAHI